MLGVLEPYDIFSVLTGYKNVVITISIQIGDQCIIGHLISAETGGLGFVQII